MNVRNLLILFFGAIMLSLFTKVFSMSDSTQEDSTLKPREIEFSNALLKFSMPENFSSDFPADDLVAQVDIENPNLFEKSNKALLLRRWWDFKEQSLFSKTENGTIMLSIYINKSSLEINNRIDLMHDVFKDVESMYKESNKTTQADFEIAYPVAYHAFIEDTFNNQRWLHYSVAPMNASEATVSYITPLSSQYYIEFAFTLMPSSAIDPREFETTYSRNFIDNIMNKTSINYADSSVLNRLGINTDSLPIEELLIEKEL